MAQTPLATRRWLPPTYMPTRIFDFLFSLFLFIQVLGRTRISEDFVRDRVFAS